MIRTALAALSLVGAAGADARDAPTLHQALEQLARQNSFSGAVVVRDARGLRFSRGYGMADPFAGRAFTPTTPVDSASLAKPVTAAAVLVLARDGRIDLDAPVQRYLPEYPHRSATVRHLLAHSAGLAFQETAESLAGKTNASLLEAVRKSGAGPLFPPGTAFNYCNLCYSTLSLLVERVTGMHFLRFGQERLALPRAVTIRPAHLADWKGRAIGYRRRVGRTLELFDSWEGEAFYGSANLSVSADQLARWGSEWWRPELQRIRPLATAPAVIAGKPSGLSWGNWYCSKNRQRCHYLGHHEGFHHMLYWDFGRRITVAMVSNNSLAPGLQQRLQRALVAYAEDRAAEADRELAALLPHVAVQPGTYRLPDGDSVLLRASGEAMTVRRRGIDYSAYPMEGGIRYVPGLDVYLAGGRGGRLHWLSLYEDFVVAPVK